MKLWVLHYNIAAHLLGAMTFGYVGYMTNIRLFFLVSAGFLGCTFMFTYLYFQIRLYERAADAWARGVVSRHEHRRKVREGRERPEEDR